MFNKFLAVASITLTIIYFSLLGASTKRDPNTINQKINEVRKQHLASERSKLGRRPSQFTNHKCYDLKIQKYSQMDQVVLQIPEQQETGSFEVYLSAFKDDATHWFNAFNCNKQPQGYLCVGHSGNGSFKLDWSENQVGLIVRTVSFGSFEAPGPVISPKEGQSLVEIQGEQAPCT